MDVLRTQVTTAPTTVSAAITCTDDRGGRHQVDLADTTVELGISEGPRKGQAVSAAAGHPAGVPRGPGRQPGRSTC